MSVPLLALLWLFSGRIARAEPAVFPRGHVFLTLSFEQPDALKHWSGSFTLDRGHAGKPALLIQRSADSRSSSARAQMPLPADRMRGYSVFISAMVRAEDVKGSVEPWAGIKFVARVLSAGNTSSAQAKLGVGTFDWKRAVCSIRIPADASEASLEVGLESVTGKVWFDDIRVIADKTPVTPPPRPSNEPVFTGHTVPRLRGVVPGGKIDEAALRLLGEQWNVNLIRWALIITGPPNSPSLDLDAYDRWLDAEMKDLDAILPLCEKYGILVLIDLHSPPGGTIGPAGYARSDGGLFTDSHCQAKFVEVWERLARRYREARAVWGYELANEPVEPAPEKRLEAMEHGLADWQQLAERAAKAIRRIDARKAIIVEPEPWADPTGFAEFQPLDVRGIVYSVHMYQPFPFTHQGTGEVNAKDKEYRYPGAEIWGRVWDKAQLEAALKPAMDFEKRYNVHIFIGEFGAVRWAPDHSAYRYLRDLIDIFEAHNWDWTYFAFRGHWNGMSVEHGDDRNDNKPAAEPTDRQQLLLEWFSHNQKQLGF
jgi:hypothetical protein